MNAPAYSRTDYTALLELQRLDSEIARHRANIEALNSDPGVAALRESADDYARATAEARDRAAKLKKSVAWEEKESDGLRAEISASEGKMYGGRVGNPKELDQLRVKVEQLRAELDRHAETGLEAMVELEEAEPALEEAVKAQAGVDKRLAEAVDKQQADINTAKAAIERLQPQRAAAAKRVPEPLRTRYERIRDGRGGVGVGALSKDGRCGACLVTVPMVLAKKVRAGDIDTCESCGRLLVHVFTTETEGDEPEA